MHPPRHRDPLKAEKQRPRQCATANAFTSRHQRHTITTRLLLRFAHRNDMMLRKHFTPTQPVIAGKRSVQHSYCLLIS
jgi:hypothetical protein